MNEDGYESGLADLCAVGDLPVLQDTDSTDVWASWDAEWRDVVILGPDNQPAATFNLTEKTLTDAENVAALKALLIEIAEGDAQ